MRRASALAALAALLFMPAALPQAQTDQSGIEIMHPWARPSLPNRPGAAYLGIHNNGTEDDRLIGASSAAAEMVEIHGVITENDVVKMEKLPFIEVPAGGMAHLGPGGQHLMLMGLATPLSESETLSVTLEFERAGTVEVELAVTDAMPMHHGHGEGEGHDHGSGHGHSGHGTGTSAD